MYRNRCKHQRRLHKCYRQQRLRLPGIRLHRCRRKCSHQKFCMPFVYTSNLFYSNTKRKIINCFLRPVTNLTHFRKGAQAAILAESLGYFAKTGRLSGSINIYLKPAPKNLVIFLLWVPVPVSFYRHHGASFRLLCVKQHAATLLLRECRA